MNKSYLTAQLNNIANAKKENRLAVANIVLKNETLLPNLLKTTFDINNKLSIKAAWVLELVCTAQPDLLVPYLNYFTENISKVHFESVVRPMAKICELIAKTYTSKKSSELKSALTNAHIDKIIETGFDWMITDQKVAVKAYAMESLYLLGKNLDWVHPELKLILEQNFHGGSPGYKARAKKILSWLTC